jgi:beta-lactamase regulating signal transducer with metallopeptidase domain
MSQMWSHPWIAAILAAAVRGAPLLLIAGVAALGWRRSSAASRHLVWLVAIAAMLALPLLSASLPAWRVALLPPPELDAIATEQPIVPLPEAVSPPMTALVSTEASVAATPAAISFDVPPAQGAPAPRDWGRIAFLVWCVGAALVALPMVLGYVRVWSLSTTAHPATGGPWGALASTLPASLGLAGRVRVMVSERATMPMAFGIVNPTVLLPADAEHWPFARRRDVMLHELAHVARRDCLTQLVSQAACALYWFDPLVWLAARALRGERERACDDAVVRAGARPSEYATHLLQVARDLRVPRAASLATVCMARRSQLSERLLAILDEHRSRRTVSRRFAVPAWIIATLIVIPASAFVPARALGTFPVIVSAIVPSEGVAPERKAVGRGTRSAQRAAGALRASRVFTAADLLGEPTQCDYGKKGNTSVSRNSDDEKETWRAHISAGDCDLTIRAIGKVRFAADLSDVQSVPPGGSFLLTESDALTTRRIEIRSDDGGRMTRKFTVDGVERPWDDEGRRWLATVLVALERRTALTADTRVPALYKQGGVDAVLQEIALLSGDHARRRYFEALFSATPSLSESETRRALEIAGAMDSDFEVAQTLIAIAKTGKIGSGSSAYLQAVRNIESDFETRRVLTALLKATTPDAEAMTLLLGVADNIESDFELAQLLLEVSDRGLASSNTREAYFKAVSTIESDFERRRVLTSILKRADNSDDLRTRLLQSASTIESDFELASFLVSFAKVYPEMSPALREAFMKAADSIDSEHEYGRVMQSIRGSGRRTSGMF